MRLKHIRLAGFKSFVDPTKVAFPEQMTCIVGPNGCGKSNVIDAVRWVLGESSAKNLRGDAMTDVIFNGSTARKPVSQASVELVFDNSERRLQGEFAAFNEISVKRLVTREGQSQYFLNGSKCRRKDITDLFLGTGLGPRSYAIIEQGMISRLIESRPQELRVFIEEAAGISRYKERRKETENRIARTRDNLERLTDVREELGKQLAKLERQAAAAKRYQSLKADERRLKSQLQALKWLHYQQQCDRAEQELKEQETELEKWLAEQRGSERGQTELREKENTLKAELDEVQQRFYKVNTEITKLEQQVQHARQLQQQREQQQQELTVQIQQLNETISAEQEELALVDEQADDQAEKQAEAEEVLAMREVAREEADEAYTQWQQDFQNFRDQKARREQEMSVAQTAAAGAKQSVERIQHRAEVVADELDAMSEVDTVALASLEKESAGATERVTELAEQWQQTRDTMTRLREQEKEQMQQLQEKRSQLQQTEGRIASLEQLLASEQGAEPPSQSWLKEHKSHGLLRELLDVPDTWQQSAEAFLQPWLTAPVIPQQELFRIADETASAVKFPLLASVPAANPVKSESLAAQCGDKGSGGCARTIELLQRIAVAESFSQAQSLLASDDWIAVLLPGGSVAGRGWYLTANDAEQSQLAWQQNLDECNQELEALTEAAETLGSAIEHTLTMQQEQEQAADDLQQQLDGAREQASRLSERVDGMKNQQQQLLQRKKQLQDEQQELNEQLVQEQEKIAELELKLEQLSEAAESQAPEEDRQQQQGEQLRTTLQQARDTYQQQQSLVHQLQLETQQLQSRQELLQHNLQRNEKQKQQATERSEELQHTAQETEISELEETLAEKLMQQEEVSVEKTDAQEALAAVQEELGVINQGQSAVVERIARQREKVEASKLELAASRERGNALLDALDDMNISLKEVLADLPDEADEKIWQQQLDETTRKVQQLGPINLAAIEEVATYSERKDYLDAQYEDLTASLDTLETAIRKIDKETRQRFRATFDAVNRDLKELFPKVFGGGSAYLDLTDDDLLETGVTIMAQPPGKKNSTIHLLSGGEKALTALALVFAIFRLNPAPFCLLDEVDAPLDDVNVGRFCRLVQEMSESVQFIFISHNKVSMEMATHLAGVTMQEPGVSRLVAVDVDEAIAMAEAS